ncbi:MAG: hypothetical protein FJX44_06070 [Alphaproteobacteria bacterium]|nr:hypothetical protein [Alphaproteobacteria bacterium]
MNSRKSLVMLGLAALVAGAAALVHAENGQGAGAGATPEVQYDFAALPPPVQRMAERIADAAQSGDIEQMRIVFESNELKPMVADDYVEDPIALWKTQSVDGTGRDILAAMLNALASGYVKTGAGHDEMYVWPYFAEMDLSKLTPKQEVELYRIVPADQAAAMKKDGKYTAHRLGISAHGVWHYFLQ